MSRIKAQIKQAKATNGHAADPSSYDSETFENIYKNLSPTPGRCRFADSGLGWKPASGDTWTLDKDQIVQASWSRAAKGYELKISTRSSGPVQLDGFAAEDQSHVSKVFKNWYGVTFEAREHSLRGWNWGKVEFGKTEMSFNVGTRPAFEIPYTEIMNTNLAGKNEVAVEFNLSDYKNGTNGTSNGTNNTKGGLAKAGGDELVEMRFYIPGAATKADDDAESGEEKEKDENEEGAELESAATVFYDTIIEKAEIGDVAGVTFATFLDVLHLTPRGRFDIDLFETSFRLRGKSYDYKVQYDHIKKFMLLPKPDELHDVITIGLDPPLRQGQTRYPFLVMQFKKEEDVTLDLNMTDEQLEKYERLDAHYEAPIAGVIAQVFRGLTGKKIITPAQSFTSVHGQRGLKCSIKANEGLLYCLEKSFLFVPKPATYVSFDNIAVITLSRVGGAMAASRTFDVTMRLKQGMGEYQFSNINREEQSGLETFFKSKGLKVKNEIEEANAMLAKALQANADDDDDDEVVGVDRGSADEDEESADDSFADDSDSDVAEEFDSQHSSEGGSDDDMEGDDNGDAMDIDEDEEEKRPKKKSKK